MTEDDRAVGHHPDQRQQEWAPSSNHVSFQPSQADTHCC